MRLILSESYFPLPSCFKDSRGIILIPLFLRPRINLEILKNLPIHSDPGQRIDSFLYMHNNAHMNQAKAVEKALSCIDSEFIKALAEPVRIEILKWLIVNGSSDVKTLAEKMPQDRSVISRHMALMEKAGLLTGEKQGRHMIYSVDGKRSLEKSEQLLDAIRQCLTFDCC